MPKIWLNERGKQFHPHLADKWLVVYGYDPNSYSFVIWDEIMGKWVSISSTHCKGGKDEAVE
jgi:hypothetical protein